MTITDPRLPLLGDALQRAAAADLARTDEARVGSTRPGIGRSRRPIRPGSRISTRARVGVALVAAALAVPAAAIATGVLSSDQRVADSIAGTIALRGAETTCTTLRDGVEYECVVDQLRNGEKIKPGEWLGVVEGSIDKTTDRVNGGCRSQDVEGTRWLCYLGEESIRQHILMPTALGQYVPSPGGP